MDDQIKLSFKYDGAESAEALAARNAELKDKAEELAVALSKGEIGWKEYQAQLRELNGESRAIEQAIRSLETAAKAQAQADRQAAAAAEEWAQSQRHAAEAATEAAAARKLGGGATSRFDLDPSLIERTVEAEHALAAAEKSESAAAVQQAQAHIKLDDALDRGATGLRVVASAADTTGGSFKNFGRTAFFASQGLEDLQYGFSAVVNNIPLLVTSMGGSLGLAAAVSIVSVGVNQLVKHWDDLTGIFAEKNPFPVVAGSLDDLDAKLDKTKKELDELKKQSSLSNDELERANELIKERLELEEEQEARRDIKKIKDTQDQQGKENAEQFQGVIKAIGGPQALADLQKALTEKYQVVGDQARVMAERILRNATKGVAAAAEEITSLFAGGYGKGTRLREQLLAGGPAEAQLPGQPINFTREERQAMARVRQEREREEDKADKERKKAQHEDFKDAEAEFKAAKKANVAKAKAAAKGAGQEGAAGVAADKEARQKAEKVIEKSGLGAQAGALFAQLQTAGVDQFGRQRKGLSQQEAFDETQLQIFNYLNRVIGRDRKGNAVRANANMSEQQKALAAFRIASEGRQQANAGVAQLAGQNLNNNGKLLAVAQNLQRQLADMQRKAEAQRREIAALLADQRPGGNGP